MSVELKNKAAFETILENYHPSKDAKKILAHMQLGIFLGLSGGGRNTIINELVATGKYHFIISDTTRPPKVRDGQLEQDGVNYYFRSEEQVLSDLRDGKFLEAELIHGQQVSGISMRELEVAHMSGKIPINEVDIAGTENIRGLKPDTKFFFVLPPTYDIWLERLGKRETMTDEELANRKATAVRVLEEANKYDDWIFIVNDELPVAVREIDDYFVSGDNIQDTNRGREIAQEILSQLR